MTVAELKKLVDSKKLIIGAQRTMKELKKGTLKQIYLSVNCAPATKSTLESQARADKITVSQMELTSQELGVLVKKPFIVSMVAVLK
ncbi:MAG TPA: ribosomal L7Ae/L30e/S12e/Gadd45 family protein [Candidatus Nanoarchaeia archaeon]|nr:ribosomal L7Ae/L30e/S12e/Gadd45 family protein [Candidatus Nanoarchaeia archaeon]